MTNRTGYNAQAVETAIRASRKPIGAKEGRMIHALLHGRQAAPRPWRVASILSGGFMGVVKPSILQMATREEAERVAQRYRDEYGTDYQTFEAMMVDDNGDIIVREG